jgi:RNA recognition motif-containing protein
MNDAPPVDNRNSNNAPQPQEPSSGMEISTHEPPREEHAIANGNANGNGNDSALIGSAHIRPIFMGNLDYNITVEDLEDLFTRPTRGFDPMPPVDRVDLKRGFAFVFFQEARQQSDKERLERYVEEINGMYVDL